VRLLALVLGATALAFALAGCGGGGGGGSPKPPQGDPALRHPTADLDAALAGEEMRAQLLEATRLYNNGRWEFSGQHMDRAEQRYSSLTDAVRLRDAALDREFHAAFGVIDGQITQRAPAPQVINRMGLMQGQLLDAAIADAVSQRARNDPGVGAFVMSTLLAQGGRLYAAAAREGLTDRGRNDFQDAFGLISRANSVAHGISPSLGGQRKRIINSIGDAHNHGFPAGVLWPQQLQPVKVAADIARAQAALQKRFGFHA
jgi:hypothetical protein